MDVQGYDFRVLRGARRLLSAGRVPFLYLEFDPRALRLRGHDSASEMVGWLLELGYVIFSAEQCGGEFESIESFAARMPLRVHCYTNLLALSVEEARARAGERSN